ncbi:YjcZ family sporulation protein [Brevibacillus reuszeri]|nr:YjcZ family sporulation protein [Brevibacillus reuszeri]
MKLGIFNGFDDFALILVLFILLVIIACSCD